MQKLNEVPFTDDRDSKQLSILMHGFAQLNNSVMDKVAAKTRVAINNMQTDKSTTDIVGASKHQDMTEDELTRLRPIR
ncbi:MAG: hypothetical protein Q9M92_17660 [Enterobacterales bacterium]|nr:hypothetical protein [Enterobacterales bacterium]